MIIKVPFNPLAYPSGVSPGFDPTHPINRAWAVSSPNGISCVTTRNGMVNLLNGSNGTSPNAPTWGVMDAHIGPCSTVNFALGYMQYPFSTYTGYNLTIGCIFIPITTGALLFGNSTAANALELRLISGNMSMGIYGVTDNTVTTYTFVAGVPYFIATSMPTMVGSGNIVYYWAVTRLDTGQMVFGEYSNPTFLSWVLSATGTCMVGSRPAATNGHQSIAAIMAMPYTVSQYDLNAWAMDPWSYWYPRKTFLSPMPYEIIGKAGGILNLKTIQAYVQVSH